MKKYELKTKLLELLAEDKDIQQAIQIILNQNENIKSNQTNEAIEKIKELQEIIKAKNEEIEVLKALVEKWKKCFNDEQEKTKNLSSSLENSKKEIEELDVYKNKILQEINSLKEEKKQHELALQEEKSKNTDLNKRVEFYKDSFEDELRVYEYYKTLSDTTKSSLKAIFKDETLQGFLSCGVQEKNISNLWEYIKNEIIEDNNRDIDKLISIFNFFFSRYILAFPIYEKQKVSIGDNFDPQLHIRSSKSSYASGTIKEIILFGWINNKTNKVIKQSVVVI